MRTPRIATLLAAALVSACVPAPATVVAPQEQPLTPLERIAGYRLTDAVTEAPGGLTVQGISPAVSGSDGGFRFMVRPATHEVMRVDATGNMAAWGKLGGEAGRFNHPESLFVAHGQVFVADTGNHRVQVFDLNGKPVTAWGTFGEQPGQFMHPRSVEVTAGGVVVVVDDYSIQYFDAVGTQLGRVPMLVPTAPVERTLAQVPATQSLSQFLASNPGAAGLANILKSKGLSDADIVATLSKGKDAWLGPQLPAATLTPAPGQTPAKPSSGAATVTASAQNVQADIFAFMALFQKLAQEMRQSARGDREAALQTQVTALQTAAEQIKQAADARFQAAIVQGAMQIGAGAIQVGSAAGKLGTAKGGEVRLDSAIGKMATSQGGERVVGSVGAGIGQASAALDAIKQTQNKARLEANAKASQAATSSANDLMQQMQDVIRDIRDKLSAIEQASVETNRGIARNI